MEQIQDERQDDEARPVHGERSDDQLLEWSSELFRNRQRNNRSVDAEYHWRLESAARTRQIIREQLREDIEEQMANELGLPANWREGKLKSLAEWHEKMACLAKADAAPRCEHVFQNGTECGSPRMKTGRLCYAHERMARVRPKKLNLLAMEDANAIMLNIMEINRALVDEEITEKRAGMLLYSQQLGLQTLGKLTFPKSEDRAIWSSGDREVGEQPATEEHRRAQIEEQNLTTEDTEGTQEFAADERRKAQIGREEVSRERSRTSTNEEEEQDLTGDQEEVATDEHRRAQSVGEKLTANDAKSAKGGMDELSRVGAGTSGTGEGDCPNRRACQTLKIEECNATQAKIGKEKVHDLTAEDTERTEDFAAGEHRESEMGNCWFGAGPLPGCSSPDLKELAGDIAENGMDQVSGPEQVGSQGAGA